MVSYLKDAENPWGWVILVSNWPKPAFCWWVGTDLGYFAEQRAGLLYEGLVSWTKVWFGELEREEPALLEKLSHANAATIRPIFAWSSWKLFNLLTISKNTYKPENIYNIVMHILCQHIILRQTFNLLRPEDQDRLILQLWMKGLTSLNILKWASQHQKARVFPVKCARKMGKQ